jgi:tagatose 6-phosphate kinase
MILSLGTTPAVQRVMRFSGFQLDHVNRALETLEGVGGKFTNVAKALTFLGEEALALGFAGGDRGEFMKASLRDQGVRFEFLPVNSRTRLCTTILNDNDGTVTELVEESPAVTPEDCDRLVEALEKRLPGAKALVLSGTIAQGGPPDLYFRCVALARKAGILTVLDAQGEALLRALEAGPNLVKPNRPELEKTVGRDLRNEEEIFAAMEELIGRGVERVVITRGAEPSLALHNNVRWRITPPKIAAVNPIGSGDSFTAALTVGLLNGLDLGEACRCGAAAGAANALTLMPAVIKRQDYERLLQMVKVEPLSR